MTTYESFREALVRASYRVLLGREPEQTVLAQQRHEQISPELEADLQQIIKNITSSSEFRSVQHKLVGHEFPLDSWFLANLRNGLKLWVDLGDQDVSRVCLKGVHEPNESGFLARVIKDGMTFVDVGANIGWFSIHAAAQVGPNGRVIAIEPRKNTCAHLVMSFAENGYSDRAEVHNAAVGATTGAGHIGWTTSPGATWSLTSASLLEQYQTAGAFVEAAEVLTLDEIVAGRNVDIIKIDIEGAEPLAFSGAVDLLRSSRPIILSEVNFKILPHISNTTGHEYINHMSSLGFDAYLLNGSSIGETASPESISPDTDVTNVVFVPSEKLGLFDQ